MLYAIVALIGLIIDQAVKYWTTANLAVNTGYKEIIKGIIHLTNVHNTGAAFSFMSGARWLFVALCIVFLVVVIVLLAKRIINTPVARWMAVLVLSGAIGNCIDRVISGYVVDMFEFGFKIFGMNFPVFNVADILITLGGIIFCICILFEKDPEREAAKAAAKEEAARGGRRKNMDEYPSTPAMPKGDDLNDPFVKWDGEPIPEEKPAPRAARPAKAAAPKAPVKTAPETPAPVKKAEPAPVKVVEEVAPVKETAPTATKIVEEPASDSFDLDDILAEFRDL